MNNDTKRPEVTETHRALARSIDIWIRQDGVSPDFIANRLAELTAAKDVELVELRERVKGAAVGAQDARTQIDASASELARVNERARGYASLSDEWKARAGQAEARVIALVSAASRAIDHLSLDPSECDEAPDVIIGLLKAAKAGALVPAFDLIAHLRRQIAFSERTFGPGRRTAGNLAHIRKELLEIEAKPEDLLEWIDVILLALDGAWRHGGTPESIAAALAEKLAKNEARTWPDWRTVPQDAAICHVKADDEVGGES